MTNPLFGVKAIWPVPDRSKQEMIALIERLQTCDLFELNLEDLVKGTTEVQGSEEALEIFNAKAPFKARFRYAKLHCVKKPAVSTAVAQAWFFHGFLHRINDPAWIDPEKSVWSVMGSQHRTDGPAVIYANGNTEYWIEGRRVAGLKNKLR